MSTARKSSDQHNLYSEDGFLRSDVLLPDAQDTLQQVTSWLEEVGRSMYLPIDMLVVLLDRGHDSLRAALARAARGSEEGDDIDEQLRALARRVDRHHDEPPRLHSSQFSLGFMGLLSDAYKWAQEVGRDQICEDDLVRVARWRAELQESASVRWAIRQLAQPGGENLFDSEGHLRREAFSHGLWNIMQRAMQMSAQAGMPFLGTPHLMASLCRGTSSVLAMASERAGVDPRRLEDELLRIVGTRTPPQPEFSLSRRTLTPRLVRMVVAASEAGDGRGPVSEAAMLQSFLDDGGSSLDLVRAMGIVPHLRQLLGDQRNRTRQVDGEVLRVEEPDAASDQTPTLDLLGRDLSAEAKAGKLPDVLGREKEIQRVVNILMRSEQRNPLLTGEAGVGKTALAIALARRIHEGKVPKRLENMRVVEINGASLVGGTSYRGELEARIKSLLSEAENDVILFMDEAHAVFAPRSSSGQPAEVPNHFKAALASGKIAVVAATTEAEYHRWIEQDPALKRRFERIEITELSSALTRQILEHLAPTFETEYEMPVTPEAVDAAIEMSERYMPEQSLPDKAKKLLMDATISVAADEALRGKEGKLAGDGQNTPSKRVVGRLDVANQVSLKTGIPVDRIVRGTIGWWVGLEERLALHVVGQDAAVRTVSHALVAGRLDSAGRRRPQGVFVFAGPPGVGKSQLSTALAEEIFGSRKALLRLEMGDFQEAHSLSRLIGTPPGYVGYQDEDALVTPLRRRPSSVVLLKDFDLAHPRVQERFVRLFEEGEISDTRGLRADATHAIFVLTISNELDARPMGFGGSVSNRRALTLADLDGELAERLKGYAYEFVVFRGLDDGDNELGVELLEARLEQFTETLQHEYGLTLVLGDSLRRELIKAVRRISDVRELERVFRERVVDPVSEKLLRGLAEESVRLDIDESALEPEPA